jgi:hypothetical protein
MDKRIWLAAIAATAWMVPAAAGAQQAGNPNDPWCKDDGWRDRGYYCEVREMTVTGVGAILTVNANPNGGIKIVGSNRRDVFVRAKVTAQADTNDEAQAMAGQVLVHTGGEIHTESHIRDVALNPVLKCQRLWDLMAGKGLAKPQVTGAFRAALPECGPHRCNACPFSVTIEVDRKLLDKACRTDREGVISLFAVEPAIWFLDATGCPSPVLAGLDARTMGVSFQRLTHGLI